MIAVYVAITTRPYKVTDLKPALLRHHVRQKRVARDIEGHTKKNISTTLIQLAREFAVRYIKLKKRMAGRQGHVFNFTYIPCRYDQAAGVRCFFDLIQYLSNLIDVLAVWCWPRTPLHAVDGPEIPCRAGPFVPDCAAVVLQPPHI